MKIAANDSTPYPWLDDIIDLHVLKLEQKWIDFERKLTTIFDYRQMLIMESQGLLRGVIDVSVINLFGHMAQHGDITPFELIELIHFNAGLKRSVIPHDYAE